jgi:hypothetical protein
MALLRFGSRDEQQQQQQQQQTMTTTNTSTTKHSAVVQTVSIDTQLPLRHKGTYVDGKVCQATA